MFRIAICDDDNIICSYIEKIILDYQEKSLEMIYVEVFLSGEELCNHMKEGEFYDLIFLDIELKLMNGIDVGRVIREDMKNEIIQIVYISGKENYYLQLFDVRPMHFLLKPIDKKKLIKDIEKSMELTNKLAHFFTYKQGHNSCKREVKDILYFEANKRKVKMVCIDVEIVFYKSLKEIYEELRKYHFILIHQSYLVNSAYITEFGSKELRISNKDILPISRQRRKEVLDTLLKMEKERD